MTNTMDLIARALAEILPANHQSPKQADNRTCYRCGARAGLCEHGEECLR